MESTWKSRPDRLGHARRDPSPLRSMGSTACIRGGRALAAVGPVQVPAEIERLVLSVAISTATWGCGRIAAYLTRTWRLRVAPSTVQRVLRRAGLATRRARLTVLEQQAARTAGLLTERTRQCLWRARYGRTRHVEASEPGELVCLDTF